MNDILKLPLARSAIDRDYLTRNNPDLFDELWRDPKTRILAMHDGKVLLLGSATEPLPKLKLFPIESVPSAQLRVYLGRTLEASDSEPKGSSVVLAVLSENSARELEPNPDAWHHLRKSGAGLDARDSGLFTQALALSNWHATHQHCPKCGTVTVVEKGGWVRRCMKDDLESFPRTDPAIIASVIDLEGRILLGSQGIWEENRWSVLAGFVEPGESLAHAVVREVFEESGVRVISPTYLGSQSWPFPFSLMVGFTAEIDPDTHGNPLVPDGDEISKLRWFSKKDLATEAPYLLLPSRISIARGLIENWYGSSIESATESE